MKLYNNFTGVIAIAKQDIVSLSKHRDEGNTIDITYNNVIGENLCLENKLKKGSQTITMRIFKVEFDDDLNPKETLYGKPIEVEGIGDLVKFESYIIRALKKVSKEIN